jgi:hypothetical protein
MPDYELWIEHGYRTLESVHAKNRAHAAAMYAEQLGLHLTLEDQDDGAYGMLRETIRTGTAHWAERHDIPVWCKGAR